MLRLSLAHGGAVDLANSGYEKAFPIDWLPTEVKYEPDAISLIPDTAHRQDRFIGLYLVNASKQPIKGINRAVSYPYQAVRIDAKEDLWEQIRGGLMCGNLSEEELTPKELPPGHVMVFMTLAPSSGGDTEGVLRYALATMDAKTEVCSKPLPGKYFAAELESALIRNSRDLLELLPAIPPGKEPFDWSKGLTPAGKEELVAKVQLLLANCGSIYIRDAAGRWLTFMDTQNSDPACRKALRALLEKPWSARGQQGAWLDECLAALASTPDKEQAYGSPGRFRETVWKQLIHLMPGTVPKSLSELYNQKLAELQKVALATVKGPAAPESAAARKFLELPLVKVVGR